MNRIGLGLGLGLVAFTLAAVGCQSEQRAITQKLDEMNKRLASIEAKIGTGAAAPGAAVQRPPQQIRPQPNPAHVYAVPIANSAFVGPKHAKVTMVEAFTFT